MTEIIGTFMLLFGVLGIVTTFGPEVLAEQPLQQAFATTFPPLLIGFLVLAIGLSLGGPTGYAINPARDLGPRIAHFVLPIAGKRDPDSAFLWVPVVGPIIGGVLGAVVFKALFPEL